MFYGLATRKVRSSLVQFTHVLSDIEKMCIRDSLFKNDLMVLGDRHGDAGRAALLQRRRNNLIQIRGVRA